LLSKAVSIEDRGRTINESGLHTPPDVNAKSTHSHVHAVLLHIVRQARQIIAPLVASPLIVGNVHPRLVIDAQSLSDPRDVVEITDDLRRDGDLLVREPALSQSLDVTLDHGSWREGKLHGVVAQGTVVTRQVGLPIVVHQLSRDLGAIRLLTEVVGVRKRSVVAVVGIAHDRG
jgi:hypothetical protein